MYAKREGRRGGGKLSREFPRRRRKARKKTASNVSSKKRGRGGWMRAP